MIMRTRIIRRRTGFSHGFARIDTSFFDGANTCRTINMGYYVTGFIVARECSRQVLEAHSSLKAVPLEQGVDLFPLTQEIVDSIVTANQLEPLPEFQYLNKSLSAFLAKISVLCPVLYFEIRVFRWGGCANCDGLWKRGTSFSARGHTHGRRQG